MNNNENWFSLFEAYFGMNLTASEIEIYQTELKKRGSCNNELCDMLRYVSQLEGDPPRADKDRRSIKFDLRDMNLWLTIYRESKKTNSTGKSMRFADRAKFHIKRLIEFGDRLSAAILTKDPLGATNEIANDMINFGGNRSYQEDEIESIHAFCRTIGFDPEAEFLKHWKECKCAGKVLNA